ncbi:hypothetical protein B6U74_05865 [Candidatus Bathyarchaeota archaeon ex4484_205]|nr:MAG: hypothetical protein B6U74_05865 [Candidatus Bathyarchaeota archaeon ex4484_205]
MKRRGERYLRLPYSIKNFILNKDEENNQSNLIIGRIWQFSSNIRRFNFERRLRDKPQPIRII